MRFHTLPATVFAMLCSTGDGFAEDYTLFNPVPESEMRDLSTDRPDKTESPITVDAGHYQFEVDLANYSYDRYNRNGEDIRSRSLGVMLINAKAGLTQDIDLQMVLESYRYQTSKDRITGQHSREDGFGDVTMRLKYNLWGNDGEEATALAVMPYIKFPTNQNEQGNDKLEGGLIVPFGGDLTDTISYGLMTQFDWTREDDTRDSYETTWVNTATIGFALTEQWGLYTEIFTALPEGHFDDWEATFDTGLTYALSDNQQLDFGVNIGLTEAAEDFNPFIGYTVRF